MNFRSAHPWLKGVSQQWSSSKRCVQASRSSYSCERDGFYTTPSRAYSLQYGSALNDSTGYFITILSPNRLYALEMIQAQLDNNEHLGNVTWKIVTANAESSIVHSPCVKLQDEISSLRWKSSDKIKAFIGQQRYPLDQTRNTVKLVITRFPCRVALCETKSISECARHIINVDGSENYIYSD